MIRDRHQENDVLLALQSEEMAMIEIDLTLPSQRGPDHHQGKQQKILPNGILNSKKRLRPNQDQHHSQTQKRT